MSADTLIKSDKIEFIEQLHEAAWYTCTANHICSLLRICRLRAQVKNALSADDSSKAHIESAYRKRKNAISHTL